MDKDTQENKRASRGGWLLKAFAGIFVAIGVAVLVFLVVPTLYTAWQARDWVPVQAQLISTDLRISQSSKGGASQRVVARYRYVWAGEVYEGDRVGLIGGGDNIGDWQTLTHDRLRHALAGDGQITVYVDPDDPAEAIFDRSPRWGLLAMIVLFALVFGGFGLGFMYLMGRGSSEAQRLASQRKEIGVGDGAIRFSRGVEVYSARRGEVTALWIFTLLWNAIALPSTWLALGQAGGERDGVLYLVLVFPLVGLFLFIQTLRRHLEWRRFGRVPLVMDPWPGAIGGDMAGTLDLPLARASGNQFRVSLACLHSEWRGSGRDRRRHESVRWECEGVPTVGAGPRGTRLAVRFRVPTGLPASQPVAAEYHLWRLHVEGEVPGIDFSRVYEIEMQAGEALTTTLHRVPYSDENAGPVVLPASVVSQRDDAQGRILDFRAGRNLWPGLTLSVFGTIFLVAGGFMAQPAVDAPAIFSGVFLLIGGLLAAFGLWLAFNRLRVILGAQAVITQRYWLGLPLYSRRVARGDIVGLQRKQTMSSNNGEKTTVWYSIVLLTRDGRRLTVVDTVRGPALSQSLGQQIAARLGVPINDA